MRRHERSDRRTLRHKMNLWQRALALFVVIACLGGIGAILYLKFGEPHSKPVTTTPDCLQRVSRGAFCTGVALPAVSKKDLAGFTSATGVFPAVIEYYQAFGNGFSKANAVQVASVNARPLIQLNPHNVSMTAITAGKYDTYLNAYAKAVRQFGHAVTLSFGHEMNGDWSTWSLPYTQPKAFIDAWRHIVTVFRDAKVKNVTWAWDITHGGHPPDDWYPGDKYVDWVGIDGYLRPGQTFAGQFWKPISKVRQFSDKPILITETAVAPGPNQVSQIVNLFTGAKQRHLMGLVWFDVNKQRAWQIQGNPQALAAFKQEAAGS